MSASVDLAPEDQVNKTSAQTVCESKPSAYKSFAHDIAEQKLILARVWLARAFQKLQNPLEYFDENNQHTQALREYFDCDHESIGSHKLKATLAKLQQQAERDYELLVSTKPAFMVNLDYLSNHLGISATEQKVLLIFAVIADETDLEIIEGVYKQQNMRKMTELLAYVLECRTAELRKALSPDSLLRQGGLLEKESSLFCGLLDSLTVPPITRRALFSENPNIEDLSSPLVRLAPKTKLEPQNYIGFENEVKLTTFYIKNALEERKLGANVLLYGAPGTGKTEFARVIAQQVNTLLLEVPCQNSSREPLKGEQRISLARQAARMYRDTPRIMLFDEAEDVFAASLFDRSVAGKHKAWINDLLETCELPMIWVSNDVSCMDAAALRRFDVIINFDVQSHNVRQQQFARVLESQANDALIATLVKHQPVTVAMVERAKTMAQLQEQACSVEFEPAFIAAINNCLCAQGESELPKVKRKQINFNPELLNCGVDIAQVLDGLQQYSSGRLCFYGPPGTGKTALGKWLSEQLKLPLVSKRASDLMGPYVGENEKRIAAAFKQAEREGAVLLIDEVDSFLSSRKGHHMSWETRMVNELLTQMETFEGIFIASTNLMDNLDEAAMRRFDMKLHFDYLTPKQSILMLSDMCQSLGLKKPTKRDCTNIKSMTYLTPGDFALIARRHQLNPLKNAAEIIVKLAQETKHKADARRRIGF